MTLSICFNSCGLSRAVKQALSSLTLQHKFPSSLQHCGTRTFASIAANKELRSTDLVALEYADLNLTDKISQVPFSFSLSSSFIFHDFGSPRFFIL